MQSNTAHLHMTLHHWCASLLQAIYTTLEVRQNHLWGIKTAICHIGAGPITSSCHSGSHPNATIERGPATIPRGLPSSTQHRIKGRFTPAHPTMEGCLDRTTLDAPHRRATCLIRTGSWCEEIPLTSTCWL